MPRIRSIKPDIWDDDAIAAVSREARLLFVGLITQADDDGRLSGDPRWLRSKIYPYDDGLEPSSIEGWLDELNRAELIQRYAHADRPCIALPAWEGNQKVDKRWYKASKLPAPPPQAASPRARRDHDAASPPEGIGEDGSGSEGSGVVARDDAPLSHLLAELIEANGSKRPAVTKRWVDAERALLAADGRPRDEAEQLIRWCQADEFWRGNVLSMPKFREKYDQLRLNAQRKPRGGAAGDVSSDIQDLDALKRRLQSNENEEAA